MANSTQGGEALHLTGTALSLCQRLAGNRSHEISIAFDELSRASRTRRSTAPFRPYVQKGMAFGSKPPDPVGLTSVCPAAIADKFFEQIYLRLKLGLQEHADPRSLPGIARLSHMVKPAVAKGARGLADVVSNTGNGSIRA